MQDRLPLPAAALQIARLTILPYRGDVARDGPPSPDLPRIVVAAPSHVITAVPLKPPARILRSNPAVPAPGGKRLRRVDAEVIQFRVVPFRTQLCGRKPALGKLAAAVGHVLPAENAKTQHGFWRQLRTETRRERSAYRFGPPIDISPLHFVVDDHFALHGIGGHCRGRSCAL